MGCGDWVREGRAELSNPAMRFAVVEMPRDTASQHEIRRQPARDNQLNSVLTWDASQTAVFLDARRQRPGRFKTPARGVSSLQNGFRDLKSFSNYVLVCPNDSIFPWVYGLRGRRIRRVYLPNPTVKIFVALIFKHVIWVTMTSNLTSDLFYLQLHAISLVLECDLVWYRQINH